MLWLASGDGFGFEPVHALLETEGEVLDLFEKTTGGRVYLSVCKVAE
jgi:hypothetical protein